MLATTLLVIVFVVAAVLLGGIVLLGRSRPRAAAARNGSDAQSGWAPAMFSGSNGGTDCSPGDAGCDGGGGGGGAD